MPDQKEFWHHGRSYWSQEYKKDMPENLLIKEVEDLNNELINLFDNFEEVGKKILSLVATALNLKENWFDNKINQGNSILRMIHYPELKNCLLICTTELNSQRDMDRLADKLRKM